MTALPGHSSIDIALCTVQDKMMKSPTLGLEVLSNKDHNLATKSMLLYSLIDSYAANRLIKWYLMVNIFKHTSTKCRFCFLHC